jgi:serine protease
LPLKVLSAWGGGSTADIAEAIRWAADHGANVINRSLGGGGDSQLMREAIDYAHVKNVTIVAAADNIWATQVKATYSKYGTGVDITAPGGSITYGSYWGGTPMITRPGKTNASRMGANICDSDQLKVGLWTHSSEQG